MQVVQAKAQAAEVATVEAINVAKPVAGSPGMAAARMWAPVKEGSNVRPTYVYKLNSQLQL